MCHSRAKKEVIAIFDGIPVFRNVTPRDKKMAKETLIFWKRNVKQCILEVIFMKSVPEQICLQNIFYHAKDWRKKSCLVPRLHALEKIMHTYDIDYLSKAFHHRMMPVYFAHFLNFQRKHLQSFNNLVSHIQKELLYTSANLFSKFTSKQSCLKDAYQKHGNN